jgi:hypothetical protein
MAELNGKICLRACNQILSSMLRTQLRCSWVEGAEVIVLTSKLSVVAVVDVAVVVLEEVVVADLTLRARRFVRPTTLSGLVQVVDMSIRITVSAVMSTSAPLALRSLVARRTTRLTTVNQRASLAVLLLGLVM